MLGSIIGDIAGSVYEFTPVSGPDFPLFPSGCDFTDDSILTVATCEVLLKNGDYAETYQRFARKYPHPKGAYGARFSRWIHETPPHPYNSWGNGSAMRVGPVGMVKPTLEAVLAEAAKSAAVTHNHPEGIKGAQATAACVFLGRTGASKSAIRNYVVETFGYTGVRNTLAEIGAGYRFNESCQGTVPHAIVAFLDSTDFESAIRNAIALRGDADTLACITGGIAQAYYREIPPDMEATARRILDPELLKIVDALPRNSA